MHRLTLVVCGCIVLLALALLALQAAITEPTRRIIPKADFAWAHRAQGAGGRHAENTVGACIHALQTGSRGIELDLHFYQGELYVHHDAWQLARGQTLAAFIPHIRRHGAWLWLDMKSLGSGAASRQQAAHRLRQLVDPRRTVIEVYDADDVDLFARRGFMTAISPRQCGHSRPTFLAENAALLPVTLPAWVATNPYTPPGGWVVWNVHHSDIRLKALFKRTGVVAVLLRN